MGAAEAGKEGRVGGNGDVVAGGKGNNGAGEGFDFGMAAGFDVLEHGGLAFGGEHAQGVEGFADQTGDVGDTFGIRDDSGFLDKSVEK